MTEEELDGAISGAYEAWNDLENPDKNELKELEALSKAAHQKWLYLVLKGSKGE